MSDERNQLAVYEASFSAIAAAHGVAPEVVADAAAHTFEMLDSEQRAELIQEAQKRWAAHAHMRTQTGVVIAKHSGQMRDDLIYRLQHEHFDLVYAVATRLDDHPSGAEQAQWLMTPPRASEPETPLARTVVVMTALCDLLRRTKQKFESVTLMQKAKMGNGHF